MFLGSTTYTLRRPAAGSYVDGEWVAGAYVEVTITAAVQPLNGDELQQLPEGARQRLTRKVYTASALQAGDIDGQIGPDILVVDGIPCEVQAVKRYTAGIPHYRAVLVAQDESDG